jgi:hypothetical protein
MNTSIIEINKDILLDLTRAQQVEKICGGCKVELMYTILYSVTDDIYSIKLKLDKLGVPYTVESREYEKMK